MQSSDPEHHPENSEDKKDKYFRRYEKGSQEEKQASEDEGIGAGCLNAIKTLVIIAVSGIIAGFIIASTTKSDNFIIGPIASFIILIVGFGLLRGAVLFVVIPKFIWYLITFRFGKALDFLTEGSNIKDADAFFGKRFGWVFLVAGLLVYGITGFFFSNASHRSFFLIIGFLHGGLYYALFAFKLLKLSEWE